MAGRWRHRNWNAGPTRELQRHLLLDTAACKGVGEGPRRPPGACAGEHGDSITGGSLGAPPQRTGGILSGGGDGERCFGGRNVMGKCLSCGMECFPTSLEGDPHGSSSCPFQDSLRKRSLRRSSSLSSGAPQAPEEDSRKVPELSARAPARPAAQEGLASSTGSASRSPLGPLSDLASEKLSTTPSSPPHLPSRGHRSRESSRWQDVAEDSPAVDGGPEANRMPLTSSSPGGSARMTQERPERVFTRQGSQPLPVR